MGTIEINMEKSRRVEHPSRRLDRRHAGLPPMPARAQGLKKATAHGANTTAIDVSKETVGQA